MRRIGTSLQWRPRWHQFLERGTYLRRSWAQAASGAPFKVWNDPRFEEKVTEVAGLYMNPPHRALVLCVDAKSQI